MLQPSLIGRSCFGQITISALKFSFPLSLHFFFMLVPIGRFWSFVSWTLDLVQLFFFGMECETEIQDFETTVIRAPHDIGRFQVSMNKVTVMETDKSSKKDIKNNGLNLNEMLQRHLRQNISSKFLSGPW